MTETFDPIARLSALKLPMPNSSQLAFCGGAKTARLQHWVDQLRATQATQTAVLLYGALPELLRLKAEASLKHELLEVLRPSVHQAILGLTREFLHQPLNLPETAQKTAIVAQALQKFMIDGYTQVILDTLKNSKSTQQGKQAFTEALHRAITALGQLFCRSFQLYTQVPSGLWSHLHLLYQVACAFEQEQEAVNDTLASKGLSRIKEAYTRVLALGAARLNQVAQQDVCLLYTSPSPRDH
jgi:hypothetical protein